MSGYVKWSKLLNVLYIERGLELICGKGYKTEENNKYI
jgi:hypothetical protein